MLRKILINHNNCNRLVDQAIISVINKQLRIKYLKMYTSLYDILWKLKLIVEIFNTIRILFD